MPKPNYISLEIDGQKADIDPAGQIPSVNYILEDEQDFEKKPAAEVFGIELPATVVNDQIHNTLHDPSVVDNTTNQIYDNFKPARYIANGQEIVIGKYLQQSVVEQNGRPVKYKGKIYGLNGDWVIDLKEKTLLDFINPLTHVFDTATIIASWSYDGRNESSDYVYAPVRYRKPFGAYPEPTEEDPNPQPLDDNVLINDLKPSISIFWLLYRAFRSVGYRLVSQFMDTDYYRRSVMPWTWGGFDFIDDTRWEPLKFLAAQQESLRIEGDFTGYPNLDVRDDIPGTYDNNNTYSYTGPSGAITNMMVWSYPTAPANLNLGKVRANLSVQIVYAYKAQNNSDTEIRVRWFKNGVQVLDDEIIAINSPAVGTRQSGGFEESFYETDIEPGDYIGARVYCHLFESGTGFARIDVQVAQFTLNFIKLTTGSEVNLTNYPKFKNYKWLDLLRGEIDFFDLQIATDPVRKEVYIEPAHAFEVDNTDYPGYHNRQQLDWSAKVDQSKESELELFSDYEREYEFIFKPDTNDGGLKKVQDRNQTTIGASKYVLPERFKAEKRKKENRFFSAVMHYEHSQFRTITGIAPQLIAMIPENVANTSGPESENTYNPKRAWYKGDVAGAGGWKFEGIVYTTLPYMFAINYKPGGENDPVLSYADQLIGGVIALGLMKKFFLQRMSIFRHGRRYNPVFVMLNNYDVANFLHRESIIIDNIEYILTGINGYNPIEEDSTACTMWMFMPVSETDRDNSYPSIESVQEGTNVNSFDIKYWPHQLLTSDIP